MYLTKDRQNSLYRAEREFGLLVGGIFTLLGVWWFYKGASGVLASGAVILGMTLVILGGLLPRLLVWPYHAWMSFAEGISFVMTRVILAIVFFLAFTPLGLVKRISGWDPLRRRSAPAETYWTPYSTRQRDPEHYEKMF